jgi:hypothetical protein
MSPAFPGLFGSPMRFGSLFAVNLRSQRVLSLQPCGRNVSVDSMLLLNDLRFQRIRS